MSLCDVGFRCSCHAVQQFFGKLLRFCQAGLVNLTYRLGVNMSFDFAISTGFMLLLLTYQQIKQHQHWIQTFLVVKHIACKYTARCNAWSISRRNTCLKTVYMCLCTSLAFAKTLEGTSCMLCQVISRAACSSSSLHQRFCDIPRDFWFFARLTASGCRPHIVTVTSLCPAQLTQHASIHASQHCFVSHCGP